MKRYNFFVVMSCFVLGSLGRTCWSASFDCQSTHLSTIEAAVCQNFTLSSLDSKLSALYTTVKANSSPIQSAKLMEEQRDWIRRRNQCTDAPCLIQAYNARITELAPQSASDGIPLVSPEGSPPSKTVARKVAEFSEPKSGFSQNQEGFNYVGGIDFNPDGSELLTCPLAIGEEVHFWQWRDEPKLLHAVRWPTPVSLDQGATLNLLAASADGSFWAFAHARTDIQRPHKAIRIFNARTGAVAKDLIEPYGNNRTMAMGFSTDGKLFIQAVWRDRGTGNELLVYRTDTWAQTQSLLAWPFTPRALAIRPDGKAAAVAGEVWAPNPHPQILVVDLDSGAVTSTIDHPFPDSNVIHSLAWTCDGASLVAGTEAHADPYEPDVVKLFNPQTRVQIGSESSNDANATSLRCSPDAAYLVEATVAKSVRIWDGRHTTLLQTIEVGKGPRNVFVGISPDSRYLAVADVDRISVWQLH
jgi:uncharacterized protein